MLDFPGRGKRMCRKEQHMLVCTVYMVLDRLCVTLLNKCLIFPEASKLVMSYVAAVCGKGAEVNQVKEQLLQSNPVLEGKFKRILLVVLLEQIRPLLWGQV